MSPQILNWRLLYVAFVSSVSVTLSLSVSSSLPFLRQLHHFRRSSLKWCHSVAKAQLWNSHGAGPGLAEDNIVPWLKAWRETPTRSFWISIEGVTEISPGDTFNNETRENVNYQFLLLAHWYFSWRNTAPPPLPASTSLLPMHFEINNPSWFIIPSRNL